MTSSPDNLVNLAQWRQRKEDEEIERLQAQVSELLGDTSDLHKPFPYPETLEYVPDIKADCGYDRSFEMGKRMKRLGDVLLDTIITIRNTWD